MSTEAVTCHVLKCDLQVSPDCEPVYTSHENEHAYHGSTPEEVRSWATGRDYDGDWISLPDGRDGCPPCKAVLKHEPHEFAADQDVPSVCRICDEWATEGPHGLDVMPGQLEMSTTTEPQ